MAIRLLRGVLHGLKWALCVVGAVALIVAAMIATPLERPPEMKSVSESVKLVDFSTMPPLERFQARDGTWIGYRHYTPNGPATGHGAIFIHGSSGSSGTVNHALTHAIAARGVETWALDIRGHGGSGTRGDVAYLGQLEDDMADLVALIRKTSSEPITLLGHSAGAGFALRMASSPVKEEFARTILLAPYLGYDAPSTRPDSGGWARADIPRILGLLALRAIGVNCCEALPVLALAVPPNSEKALVATYTDRLMRNFGTGDFRRDLATATKPLTIICGADDELMLADKYVEAVRGAAVPVDVRLLDGINHMGIVAAPKAVSLIADDVATRAMAGS